MKPILIASFALLFGLASSHSGLAGERSKADLERDKSSKPKQIIEFVGVKKGDSVLDFLGGGGYYSQIMKHIVGEDGEVVLQTNKAYLNFVGEALKKRTESGGLKGVKQLVSEADNLKLGKERFDLAILVLGYHDFFFKQEGWDFSADQVMPQLRQSLKPGGRLLIIDHAAGKDSGIRDVKTLHRIDENYVKKDIESRGFKLIKQSDLLRNSQDAFDQSVFTKELRRKTDRFVHLYVKR